MSNNRTEQMEYHAVERVTLPGLLLTVAVNTGIAENYFHIHDGESYSGKDECDHLDEMASCVFR